VESQSQELIPVIYQDEQLLVVHKPAGLQVHRGLGADREDTFLLQLVRDQTNQFLYPVHRLDRPTSGLVVFALDSNSARLIQESWKAGQVQKSYQAIIRGWMPEPSGLCDEALDDPDNGNLQDAQTSWRQLETFSVPIPINNHLETRLSLVELEPFTGRYHQLRRHFSRLHHPILGDTTHGDRHHNHWMQKHFGWWRLMLFAYKLSFPHPTEPKIITIEDSPCRGAASFWDILKKL